MHLWFDYRVVGTDWYMFIVVYLTVKVWKWFHHLFDTYISWQQDGARKGGCSLLFVGAGESGSWSFLQVGA
jgi:hypothetical protein